VVRAESCTSIPEFANYGLLAHDAKVAGYVDQVLTRPPATSGAPSHSALAFMRESSSSRPHLAFVGEVRPRRDMA
jgi:hypothetical protein